MGGQAGKSTVAGALCRAVHERQTAITTSIVAQFCGKGRGFLPANSSGLPLLRIDHQHVVQDKVKHWRGTMVLPVVLCKLQHSLCSCSSVNPITTHPWWLATLELQQCSPQRPDVHELIVLPGAQSSSGDEGFQAYVRAVKARLACHGFTRPFNLAEDPREQDEWNTWVEYLDYIYFQHDMLAATLKEAEPRYKQAWEDLEPFDIYPVPRMLTDGGKAKEEFIAAREQLHSIKRQLRRFFQDTRLYREHDKALANMGMRAEWALGQLALIEAGLGPSDDTEDAPECEEEDKEDEKSTTTSGQHRACIFDEDDAVSYHSMEDRKRNEDEKEEGGAANSEQHVTTGHKRARTSDEADAESNHGAKRTKRSEEQRNKKPPAKVGSELMIITTQVPTLQLLSHPQQPASEPGEAAQKMEEKAFAPAPPRMDCRTRLRRSARLEAAKQDASKGNANCRILSSEVGAGTRESRKNGAKGRG